MIKQRILIVVLYAVFALVSAGLGLYLHAALLVALSFGYVAMGIYSLFADLRTNG